MVMHIHAPHNERRMRPWVSLSTHPGEPSSLHPHAHPPLSRASPCVDAALSQISGPRHLRRSVQQNVPTLINVINLRGRKFYTSKKSEKNVWIFMAVIIKCIVIVFCLRLLIRLKRLLPQHTKIRRETIKRIALLYIAILIFNLYKHDV